MADDQRPKMGEEGYTEGDGKQDTAALERAAMKSPEAVNTFYTARGGAPFTAGALALACRYKGIDTVRTLLAHGASFLPNAQQTRYPMLRDEYELMVLAGTRAVMKRKKQRTIPAEERLEIVRALLEAGAADFSEVLYQAILQQEFPIARELLAAGKELPASRVTLIGGSAGFINPGQGVTEGDRREFRKALQKADNPALMEMITLMRRCPGIDKVAVYDLDVCSVVKYVSNSKKILDRFKSTEMLLFMLENTTMRKVVTRRMLVELLVENDDAQGLQWLVDNGFLNRSTEISMLFEVLDEASGAHAEMRAIAVAHKAKHQPKNALSIPTDPLAASILRKIWQYETADDGKTIRILRYKGDGDTVVIPPRIGRRTVSEIAETAFSPPAPPRRRSGYGRYNQPFVPPAPEECFASVSFPGTIRMIPRCLGLGNGCATASEITLQEGIEEIAESAFMGTKIKALTLPESMHAAGDGAFKGCASLAEVHLASGLQRLPEDMFAHCRKLRTVTGWSELREVARGAFRETAIESADLRSVRTIGEAVFLNCSKLREVLLPDNSTEIPVRMFAGCASLEGIPECPGLEQIGSRAFDASGLRHIRLSERIQMLGRAAFAGCTNLLSAEFDGPVRYLADNAFDGCTALRSVSLPEGMEIVGKAAFRACRRLADIELPDSVHTIGRDAFRNSGLAAAHISARIKVGSEAFANCAQLKDAVIEDGTTTLPDGVFQKCGELTQVHLPETVKAIGRRAFQQTGLQHIGLPPSLTKIGDEAFAETPLKSVEIPDGVREIGASAFRGTDIETVRIPPLVQVGAGVFERCRELREAYVAGSVQLDPRSGSGLFSACRSLTKLVLGDDALQVPPRLCDDTRGLEEVEIPDTVTQIGQAAFRNCGLRTFKIPDSVTAIGEEAFAGSSLEEIVIPDSVTEIGPGAFKNCRNLRKVALPASLQRIPNDMFQGCASLQTVDLPDTLADIGESAFKMSALAHVRIPDGVKVLRPSVFQGCTSLQNVEAGQIDRIQSYTFADCEHLEQIHLPSALKDIGTYAFASTGLRRIEIPASVHTIGKHAFDGCWNLDEIIMKGEHTRVLAKAFSGTPASRRREAPISEPESAKKKKKRKRRR